jgi:hypothetical protein
MDEMKTGAIKAPVFCIHHQSGSPVSNRRLTFPQEGKDRLPETFKQPLEMTLKPSA